MNFASLNWLAVLVCIILSMVTGSLWYNPKTFFPIWWKGIGKTDKDTPGGGSMALTWFLTIAASVVEVIALAFMIPIWAGLMTGGVNALTGLGVGWMIWFGFIAPTSLVNKLFAGHGLKIWAIEAGHHLLNLLLFGAILGAWQ